MASFSYDRRLCGHGNRSTIRVIDLEPGAESCPVICSLRYVSLDARPDFDAISYCWGGQTPTRAISCNDAPLFITHNLYDALVAFRSMTHTVTIWADAVCINQDDNDEKSCQVAIMARIYGVAVNVKIWLGRDENCEAETAFGVIERMYDFARQYSEQFSLPLSRLADPGSRWTEAGMQPIHPPEFEPHWPATIRFLQRPWFSRVWVMQEVAMSYRNAHLHCGRRMMKWETFVDAYLFSVRSRLLIQPAEMGAVVDPRRFTDLRRSVGTDVDLRALTHLAVTTATYRNCRQGLSLLKLLIGQREMNSTDPRDRVFAVLSMARRHDDAETDSFFEPDYSHDEVVVYQRVTERFLAQFQTLFILSYAGHSRHKSASESQMPSWVVDLSQGPSEHIPDELEDCLSMTHSSTLGYDASLTSLFPKTYRVLGKILEVQGFVVDDIAEVVTVFDSNHLKALLGDPDGLDFMNKPRGAYVWMVWLYRAYRIAGCDSSERYKTGEDFLEVFIKTLFAGRLPDDCPMTSLKILFQHVLGWGRIASVLSAPGLTRFPKAFVLCLRQTWRDLRPAGEASYEISRRIGKKLFGIGADNQILRTRQGYIGRASRSECQPGDKIVLVRGAQFPFILRPTGTSRLQCSWELMSPCYVPGMMEGELFDAARCETLSLE